MDELRGKTVHCEEALHGSGKKQISARHESREFLLIYGEGSWQLPRSTGWVVDVR